MSVYMRYVCRMITCEIDGESSLWHAHTSYIFHNCSLNSSIKGIGSRLQSHEQKQRVLCKVKKVKSFLSSLAHGAVLISVTVAVSKTPAYAVILHIRG